MKQSSIECPKQQQKFINLKHSSRDLKHYYNNTIVVAHHPHRQSCRCAQPAITLLLCLLVAAQWCYSPSHMPPLPSPKHDIERQQQEVSHRCFAVMFKFAIAHATIAVVHATLALTPYIYCTTTLSCVATSRCPLLSLKYIMLFFFFYNPITRPNSTQI